MIRNNYFKSFPLKIKKKKMPDHISALSNQNGDLVGHTSFQERKIICCPDLSKIWDLALQVFKPCNAENCLWTHVTWHHLLAQHCCTKNRCCESSSVTFAPLLKGTVRNSKLDRLVTYLYSVCIDLLICLWLMHHILTCDLDVCNLDNHLFCGLHVYSMSFGDNHKKGKMC